MRLGGWDYLAVFASTLVLTLVLTPMALRVAVRRQILDHPGAIKTQASAIPYLGGAAIVLAFATTILVASALSPPTSGIREIVAIVVSASVLAIVGLVDDLRGLSPWLRLAAEILAGVVVWQMSEGSQIFASEALDALVTVIWIVVITNALNLLDNMDGLSAGVAGIASLALFLLAADNGQFLVATLAIALAGCAAGFLRSNFHPARIYMGDAGALFLGFLLAVLAMKLDSPEAPRSVALGVPLLLLGIPLFDTALVTVNRLVHRRNPMTGGRDHTSHRLVFVGIPVPAAVVLIYIAAASLGVLSVVLARQDQGTGLLLIGWVFALSLLVGALLSRVPVYETSRRRHLMLQEVVQHEPEPPAGIGRDEPLAAEADG